jgi:hypothetical protein
VARQRNICRSQIKLKGEFHPKAGHWIPYLELHVFGPIIIHYLVMLLQSLNLTIQNTHDTMLPRLNYLIIYLGIATAIISFFVSTVRVQCALCGPNIAVSCRRQSFENSDNHVSKDNLLDVQNNTLGVR